MLELKGVKKCYGKKVALEDVNLTFKKGIYGLLGPNGAGKSTMMNIITDVLEASEGAVFYDEQPIKKLKAKYREKIAYLPQRVGYYADFTAEKTLAYFAMLRGVKKDQVKERIRYSLEAVHLLDAAKSKVGTFSGGMKQRLGIAITLVSDPEILIFDEPTVGLDPKERVKFRGIIGELAKEKTILLSTHIVSDVESIADYIILIKEGKIIGNGTKEDVIRMMAEDRRKEEKAGHGEEDLSEEELEKISLEDVYMYFYDEKSEE